MGYNDQMNYIPFRLKILGFILILITVFSWIANAKDQNTEEPQVITFEIENEIQSEKPASGTDRYDDLELLLADITSQLQQPNVLKEDIVRGWYLASENERRYGTPNTWIFIEDGENSKWISPNAIDDVELVTDKELCKQTAGQYAVSCLETTESECEFIVENECSCTYGSNWKDDQGCILTSERGGYAAINSLELNQGWYLGLPSQKKLNTPASWKWVEAGRKSSWRQP